MRRLVVPIALVLGTGCYYETSSPLPADFGVCEADPPAGVAPPAPTYYRDVKPIVDRACTGCHIPGGVAPFPLLTYDDVFRRKEQVSAAVVQRIMPPWQPSACCGDFLGDRSLTADQIATIEAWQAAGGEPGDPADTPPGPPPRPDSLPRVDVATGMAAPYQPSPRVGKDDLRCFLLPYEFSAATNVIGLNVVPGNRQLVHHVIVYAVAADKVDALAARDGRDGRPGWDCYGGIDEIDTRNTLGGWQPGDGPTVFREGVGAPISPGMRLVMNVHYDTLGGGDPDQSRLELMTTATVARVARAVGVFNPLWFLGDGMRIEAGDPDATVFFAYDPTVLATRGEPLEIEHVMVHMHELGSAGRLGILHPDGSATCLLDIPDFQFHWMTTYQLANPVRLMPGDRIYLECHWDNTAANQQLVDGELQAPRTLGWGADEEMCAAVIGYSEPA